jgi:ferric-dicitrate binding protein FerR (iron transport regulator)
MEEQNLAIADIIYKYRKHDCLTDEEIAALSSWLSESAEREAWFDMLQGEACLQVEPQQHITAGGKWELWNQYHQHYPVGKEIRTSLKLLVSAVVVVIAMFGLVPAYVYCGLETPVNQCTLDIDPGRDKAMLDVGDVCRFALDTSGGVAAKRLNGSTSYYINYKCDAQYVAQENHNQVVLPDGSKVWLNAGSSLTFPVVFNGTERRVQLNGEGYFEVMNIDEVPFVVSLLAPGKAREPTTEVKVLGTHLNINAYGEEECIKTTLLEGKVKVALRRFDNRTVVLPQEQQGVEPGLPVTAMVGR